MTRDARELPGVEEVVRPVHSFPSDDPATTRQELLDAALRGEVPRDRQVLVRLAGEESERTRPTRTGGETLVEPALPVVSVHLDEAPWLLAAAAQTRDVVALADLHDVLPDCSQAPGSCGDPPVMDMAAYELHAASACPWDCGCDGGVGITDFIELLVAWGPNPGHPADFDGDGIVGIVDFLELLTHWGACS